MKIYHGSKSIIQTPIVKGSKLTNDYGPAFYMTKDIESAREWACRNNLNGYVNEYDFDIRGLRVLDLRKENPLTWIAILMHFRSLELSFVNAFKARLDFLENNYYVDVSQFDVVIGYRADDAYFRFPADFIRGNLTLEQLEKSFFLGKLGVQVVLMTERAIKRLKFIDAFAADQSSGKYYETIVMATKEYDSLSKDEDGTRIFDLMKGTKNDLP